MKTITIDRNVELETEDSLYVRYKEHRVEISKSKIIEISGRSLTIEEWYLNSQINDSVSKKPENKKSKILKTERKTGRDETWRTVNGYDPTGEKTAVGDMSCSFD